MQTQSVVSQGPHSTSAAAFRSILFEDGTGAEVASARPPACFRDLNLDRVIDAIVAGREEYDLKSFFHVPLSDLAAIEYRHEVMRDLENKEVRSCVEAFTERMRAMRRELSLAQELRYRRQQEAWFLAATSTYFEAIGALTEGLSGLQLEARGLLALREFLATYAASEGFAALGIEAEELRARLASVRYRLDIKGNRIRVSHHEGEPNYSEEVAETFAKFRQGAVKDYRVKFASGPEMNHVEAALLDLVARLFPDVFEELAAFRERHDGFADAAIVAFDREIQFYLAYLDYVAGFAEFGLDFCYPRVSEDSKEGGAADTFDIALAGKLAAEGEKVVCNQWRLEGPERIFVVSGPNQGGKTTFARTFGQLHYLALIGCQVPGRDARLFLCDRIFTHFERREEMTSLSGKLEDDLKRVHAILREATPRSVIVMNESFGSTTLNDARFLGTEVLQRIVELEALCVYVTFVDELASLGPSVVSLMSTVDPEDPAVRTFEVVRKPADGRAYATAIARKYGLTFDAVKERIAR
jgi:DNA mismatch repair protein MutS